MSDELEELSVEKWGQYDKSLSFEQTRATVQISP